MLPRLDTLWIAIICTVAVLGVFHAIIWLRQREERMHGAFAVLALAVAACAVLESHSMRSETPAEYSVYLRWGHFTVLPMVAMVVLFFHQLSPNHRRLGIAAVATRAAAVVANFLTGDNLSYTQITALRSIPIWDGDAIVGPVGTPNPWLALAQLSNLLLIAFIVAATRALWRQPRSAQRTRKLRVAFGLIGFVLAAIAWHVSLILLDMPLPTMLSPAFLGIALVLSVDLIGDVLRAAQLASRLQLVESDLDNRQRELDFAVRAAGLGHWRWDVAAGRVWLSQRGAQMLGLPDGGDCHATQVGRCIDGDDLARLRLAAARSRRAKSGDFRVEFRVGRDAQQRRWLLAHGQRESTQDSAQAVLHGVLFDVTEQRSADEHFRLVVGASPTAMLLVDGDGRILLANAAATALSGYAASELADLGIDALVPAAERETHVGLRAGYLGAASRRQMQPRREVSLQRKDGSQVAVEVALSPMQHHGRTLVIAAINDISERKTKDREIKAQRDALAHMSRIGMLSELSGSLAHELNQPLAAILSNAQASVRFLNREQPDLEEVREGLLQIIESDKRASEVIRRLRAMLRKDPSDRVPLDLNRMVRDVLQMLRVDLIDRRTRLHEELEENLPQVLGDAVQLQQVILNLVLNACDAMGDVAGERVLTLRTQAGTDGQVLLQVADVGRGIPEADLDQIFAPFVTTKRDGLGLGLALCTSLVKAHGGSLRASNNPGGGATLHVLLPAVPRDPGPPDP